MNITKATKILKSCGYELNEAHEPGFNGNRRTDGSTYAQELNYQRGTGFDKQYTSAKTSDKFEKPAIQISMEQYGNLDEHPKEIEYLRSRWDRFCQYKDNYAMQRALCQEIVNIGVILNAKVRNIATAYQLGATAIKEKNLIKPEYFDKFEYLFKSELKNCELNKLLEAQEIVRKNGKTFIKNSKKYAVNQPVFDSKHFQDYLIKECDCTDCKCNDKIKSVSNDTKAEEKEEVIRCPKCKGDGCKECDYIGYIVDDE